MWGAGHREALGSRGELEWDKGPQSIVWQGKNRHSGTEFQIWGGG